MKPRFPLMLRITLSCWVVFCGISISRAQPSEVVPQSWAQVKQAGKGTVIAYWYESRPFIYRTPQGMAGLEYELMEGFRRYLKKNFQVELEVVWKEADNFGDTYASIRDGQQNGTFGVSAFSITADREKEVAFSPPYMADISVLITSRNIPIVHTSEEFNRVFSRLKAVTIRETTYEQDIYKLKTQGNLSFDIEYIPSSKNILEAVDERDSAFAFIDLPVYMMMFENDPSINVKRQNMFPVMRKGYALIYPQTSDWAQPVESYFSHKDFHGELERIIAKYLDLELYHFIEGLAIQSNNLVALLTKEKEIQSRDLLGKAEQLARETRALNFLLALVTVSLISMVIIILLYRKRSQQKKQIERQREQLAQRNRHLVALDEEKNNLIKILAHDLRTPINHVQGLAQVFLLGNNGLPDDQKDLIQKIIDSSERLTKMINNILDIDSIEQRRVKILMDEVPISPLVSEVVKSFDKVAAKKNIDLSITSLAETARVRGDSLFLTQVFENLMSNAIKFSAKGKKVEVSTREEGNNVWISFRDSGPGLTPEDQKLLFRKFQRLSAKPTDGETSIGLGLSIVKKYVELMGGNVWCESEPQKGACFIVGLKKA
ncbi:transporter substrate-binding domain-containing protein [Fulvivirgaceae bacterium PWU4]|uniref:histidine kinase n=1 Tax=Chryseosolibacter histidini TaxID=2782349 RepID=A0AAP2GSD0_9BACT|nr:ATP-binding protein [Chryseosolibacter histidini]MBT1701005.1 transporter substrate-binding domain-containing protein [Chryseosolibacter histidini]